MSESGAKIPGASASPIVPNIMASYLAESPAYSVVPHQMEHIHETACFCSDTVASIQP